MRLILEALSLDIGEIKNRVDWALRTLVLRDSILISKRLSEETVAHRLAIYLESLFPKEYDVDCEYNKIVDAEGNNTVPKVVPTRIPTETRPNRTERQFLH